MDVEIYRWVVHGGAEWLLIHEGRVGVALNPFLAAIFTEGGSVLIRAKGWSERPRAFGVVLPAQGWKPGFLLVPVYAPLVSKTRLEDRGAFREQLSKIFDHSSCRRRLLIGGDFMAKSGPPKIGVGVMFWVLTGTPGVPKAVRSCCPFATGTARGCGVLYATTVQSNVVS